MMGRTHMALAAAAWAGATALGLLPLNPVLAGLAVFGGLLPDIDHAGSKIGRRLPVVSWVVSLVAGHRGVTHSLVFVGLAEAICYGIFGATAAVALAIGCLSHLAADVLTVGGAPLFWPDRERVSLRLMRTGSIADTAVGVMAATLAVVLVLAMR